MSRRVALFDNAKFLLITFVVIGHLLELGGLKDSHRLVRASLVFIYSFHMPVFLFLSGLFLNRQSLTAEKTKTHVVYFCILGYLIKIINALFAHLVLHRKLYFVLLADGGVPWFAFVLALYYLCAWVLRDFDFVTIEVIALMLGLFVGYDSSIGDYLYLSRAIVFFPFFWLGHALNADDFARIYRDTRVRVACAVVVVMFAGLCIFRTQSIYPYKALFTGRNPFQNVAIPNCSFLNRGLAYLVTAVVGFCFMGIVPKGSIPYLSQFGTRTLQVYAFHYLVVYAVVALGVYETLQAIPYGWLLFFPMGFAISSLLSIKVIGWPITAIRERLH